MLCPKKIRIWNKKNWHTVSWHNLDPDTMLGQEGGHFCLLQRYWDKAACICFVFSPTFRKSDECKASDGRKASAYIFKTKIANPVKHPQKNDLCSLLYIVTMNSMTIKLNKIFCTHPSVLSTILSHGLEKPFSALEGSRD